MDLIDDVFRPLKAAAPGLPEDVMRSVENEMRQRWGGREPYMRKRVGTCAR